MVDEFRDTNYAQYIIVRNWQQHMKIFVLWVMMHKVSMHSEALTFKIFLNFEKTIRFKDFKLEQI